MGFPSYYRLLTNMVSLLSSKTLQTHLTARHQNEEAIYQLNLTQTRNY